MSTVPQIIASLDASATRADTSSRQMYGVANGPASGTGSTVATDSGPVPSLAKWFADNQAAINAQANLEARLRSSTDAAQGSGVPAFNPSLNYVAGTIGWALKQNGANVKWFGAKGDGTTDDWAVIQGVLNLFQVVYLPAGPGQYLISQSITFTNQRIIGGIDNGTESLSNNQTMILCDGTFPAFKYQHPSGYVSQGGAIENFNIVFADGLRPATATSRPNAWGVYIDDNGDTTGYPSWMSIKSITVRGGMGVIYDKSGSWMMSWDHLHGHQCFTGFYKKGGTTISARNCFSREAFQSWRIESVLGFTMDACAYDLSSFAQTGNGYYPCYISESNVVMKGTDIEAPNLAGNQNALLWADSNSVVHISGMRVLNPQITGAPELYLFKASNSAKIIIDGVDCRTPAYSGTPGVFAYFVAVSSGIINVRGATLPAVTGVAPSVAYAGLATTGSINYTDVDGPYLWGSNSCRTDQSLRFKVTETIGAIPSSGTTAGTTRSYTITGAAVGDYVHTSFTTPLQGLQVQGEVTAADTVQLTFRNPTGSTITLPSAVTRIRVVREIDP